MNLFMNSISNPCYLGLFDNNRKIIRSLELDIKWNESSKLIPELQIFLDDNKVLPEDLENIVVVHWPGSFTWVRTTVLIANTLNYIIKKNMTQVSYFDLFDEYPVIKSSSKKDCFVQKYQSSNVDIISNKELDNYFIKNNITEWFWEVSFEFKQTVIVEKIDYTRIIKNIELEKLSKIEPLYLKKPNIS